MQLAQKITPCLWFDNQAEDAAAFYSQCGWLKDRFGLSWQVTPRALSELVGSPDDEKSQRAMKAMLQMKKIDLAKIHQAHDGTAQ